MIITIHTDGGARGNPGPAACAAVIKNGEGRVNLKKYLGEQTNNVAEYQGVLLALEWCNTNIEKKAECELTFFLDSLLVVSQLKGDYKIKNENLVSLANQITTLLKNYKKSTFTYVPRAQNADADKLVNECLDENKNV